MVGKSLTQNGWGPSPHRAGAEPSPKSIWQRGWGRKWLISNVLCNGLMSSRLDHVGERVQGCAIVQLLGRLYYVTTYASCYIRQPQLCGNTTRNALSADCNQPNKDMNIFGLHRVEKPHFGIDNQSINTKLTRGDNFSSMLLCTNFVEILMF
jgi:hypothetical protein